MSDTYQPIAANAIKLVQLVQEATGTPGSFPSGRAVYKAMPVTLTYDKIEGPGGVFSVSTDNDRAIYVYNFRNNTPVMGAIYIAVRVGPDTYVIDNQMTFLENM